jgi:hypothetical protein
MQKLILSVMALLLSACVSNVKVSENQAITTIPKDKAQIVFLRSTSVNALVNTAIYDVTTGTPKLVGNIPNGTKVVAEFAPGDYVFMVGNNGHQDILRASVLAQKRYHVVVNAYWPANFSMRPFRQKDGEFTYASGKFTDLMGATKIVMETPESIAKADQDKEKTAAFYKHAWQKWQARTNEQKETLTLNKEDYLD